MTISITQKPEFNVVNVGDEITTDQLAAIQNATNPSPANPFATIADVGGGGGGITNPTTISELEGYNNTYENRTTILVPFSSYESPSILLEQFDTSSQTVSGSAGFGVTGIFGNPFDPMAQAQAFQWKLGGGQFYVYGWWGNLSLNEGVFSELRLTDYFGLGTSLSANGIFFSDGSFQSTAASSGAGNVVIDNGSWAVGDYALQPNDYAVANDGGNISLSGWTVGQSAIVVCGNGATNNASIGGLGTIYDYGTFSAPNTLSAGMVAKIVCIATDEYHLIQLA